MTDFPLLYSQIWNSLANQIMRADKLRPLGAALQGQIKEKVFSKKSSNLKKMK